MRRLPRLAPAAFFAVLLTVQGDPPAWWQEGETPVIDPTATANNSGPANIGQAKWMAMRALETLDALGPALATGIRDQLTLPQPQPDHPDQSIPPILDFTIPQPLPADWLDRQRAPLLIGQLKAIAAPFYDQLHAVAPDWLDHQSSDPALQGQLQLNGTKDPHNTSHFYPWSADPADDQNQAPATIGQLKAVFSLRFETLISSIGGDGDTDMDGLTNWDEITRHRTDPFNPDSDGDGQPDGWEITHGLDPNKATGDNGPNGDPDKDGLTNAQEFLLGKDPFLADNPGILQETIANGDFSSPRIGTGKCYKDPNTAWDYWPELSLTDGWSAVRGTHIEYQTIEPYSPGNPYCELKADPGGHYGIKQRVGTRAGVTYLLFLDCKARAHTLPSKNNFSVLIDGSPVKSITFNTSNSTAWTNQMIPFTASKVITEISLVPDSFPDDTMGCLIDNITIATINLAVDANRDGEITFDGKEETSENRPYRFWLNDNQDQVQEDKAFGDFIPETIPPIRGDLYDLEIKSTRDLQDFTRLCIRTTLPNDKLVSGEIRVGFKWVDTPPNTFDSLFPAIRLFEHVEKDGGLQYIKNPQVAQRQFEEKVTALADVSGTYPLRILRAARYEHTSDFIIPNTLWTGTTASAASTLHLLFEGVAEGRARLATLIMDKDRNVIGEGQSVWVDIKNIESMYMRAYTNPPVTDFRDPYTIFKDQEPVAPAPYSYKYVENATNVGDTSPRGHYGVDIDPNEIKWMPGYNDGKPYLKFEPAPDEEKKCVVFVHGINMNLDDIRAYTAAFYKRLWWEGYKGRLAVFCWPTKLNTGPGPDFLYSDIFNTSEYRAWTAGSALKKYVESLKEILGKDSVIGLAAHSLGNVCAGSALRQGMVVDNYVMLEAALSTSCLYGPAVPGEPDLLAGHFHTSLANADGSDIDTPSPYDCNDFGYRGYLMDIKKGVKNKITNYHNDYDFWLASGRLRQEFPSLDFVHVDWVCNQAKYKPNDAKSYGFYPIHELTQGGTVYGRPVVSAHESMSFISRSRTRPIGSEPPIAAGGIPVPPFDPRYCFNVDLKNTYKFSRARSNHSGQFLREIYQLYYDSRLGKPFEIPFYRKLLDDLGVLPET